MRYHWIILIFLAACSNGTDTTTEKLPKLISCSHEFVATRKIDDHSYYDDHKNFIRKYFSVRYEEKRIVATTLIDVQCSDSLAGKIEVLNDTIFLKKDVIMTSDRHCPELHKFTFVISNPENKKYNIVSSK